VNRQRTLAAALVWAAAMFIAALCSAPPFFAQILLPLMAVLSVLPRASACLSRSATP
jgi:hypothetical protein